VFILPLLPDLLFAAFFKWEAKPADCKAGSLKEMTQFLIILGILVPCG
jgi:hypothetical protein